MTVSESTTELRVPIRTAPSVWKLRELANRERRDLRLHAAVLLEEIIDAKYAALDAETDQEQVA